MNHSRSLPDFVANYQSDLAEGKENWGHARLSTLSGEEKKRHQTNVRQKRNQAKKNFGDLREALRGIDLEELNTRMLNKVRHGVEKNVQKEIQRVAALMKKNRDELGENASSDASDAISRAYANTLEVEWPALSTTPPSEDTEMNEEVYIDTHRLNSCNNSAERRRTHANGEHSSAVLIIIYSA